VYFEVSVAMLNNNEGGTSHLKGKDERDTTSRCNQPCTRLIGYNNFTRENVFGFKAFVCGCNGASTVNTATELCCLSQNFNAI
jgi:hypothetical protein